MTIEYNVSSVVYVFFFLEVVVVVVIDLYITSSPFQECHSNRRGNITQRPLKNTKYNQK